MKKYFFFTKPSWLEKPKDLADFINQVKFGMHKPQHSKDRIVNLLKYSIFFSWRLE